MTKNSTTAQAIKLNDALNRVGVETKLEHHDGHKRVDIFIPKGNIYVEIDGSQHYTTAYQIQTDFARDHYSDDDGFHTIHLTNKAVEKHTMRIDRALKKVVSF